MSPLRENKTAKKARRPLTAYNFFFRDRRQEFQARLFKITGQRPTYTQISKFVGKSWRNIKPDAKARYELLAIKDKRRYALDLIKAKEEGEKKSFGEMAETSSSNRSSSPLGSYFIVSDTPSINAEPAKMESTAFAGNDLCSASYQSMLRESLDTNTMHESEFFDSNNPHMLAQLTLLSNMMIDYVQSVAPERLAIVHQVGGHAMQSLPATAPDTSNNEPTELFPDNSWMF